MKYLVLTRFRSYGKQFEKGMVVDESEIRSPMLRMSEGKIIPAVSSSTVPAEPGDDITSEPASQDVSGDVDTGDEDETVDDAEQVEEPETAPLQEPAAPPKKPLFTFNRG